MKQSDPTVMQRVLVYLQSMQGEQSGSITLHVHAGKVVRIEKREVESTATMPLVTP